MRLAPFLLLLVLSTLAACSQPEKPEEATAPAATGKVDYATALQGASFVDLDGKTVSLSEFKGKTVMIDFWETWCTPCLKAFPSMSKAMKEYPDNFVVLAVNLGESDQAADVVRFRDANPDYPFFWLKDNGLASKLQIGGIPFKIFISPDGTYHSSELGLAGSEDANYDKLVQFIQSQMR